VLPKFVYQCVCISLWFRVFVLEFDELAMRVEVRKTSPAFSSLAFPPHVLCTFEILHRIFCQLFTDLFQHWRYYVEIFQQVMRGAKLVMRNLLHRFWYLSIARTFYYYQAVTISQTHTTASTLFNIGRQNAAGGHRGWQSKALLCSSRCQRSSAATLRLEQRAFRVTILYLSLTKSEMLQLKSSSSVVRTDRDHTSSFPQYLSRWRLGRSRSFPSASMWCLLFSPRSLLT